MAAHTTLNRQESSSSSSSPSRPQRRRGVTRNEVALVAGLVALALALRLVLAARGWPQINSDEGVLGLMARDIEQGRAHPVFYYGQEYMGAWQAYLVAVAFKVLGPTSFAIRVVAAVQVTAALLFLYLFTRLVFSRAVALITLALLTIGPAHALSAGQRAGAGIQDTLFFGALVLLLTALRVRWPQSGWVTVALDAGIGLAIGLGLWCDFLIVPFVLAALLALVGDVVVRHHTQRPRRVAAALLGMLVPLVSAIVLGMSPLLAANLASHGATFTQVRAIANGYGTSDAGPLTGLLNLGQQVLSTLVVGLPQTVGASTICPACHLWPDPQHVLPPTEVLRTVLFTVPLSLVVIALWFVEALPLAREAASVLRARLRSLVSARPLDGARGMRGRMLAAMAAAVGWEGVASASEATPPWRATPARATAWWGRVMLVVAAGLTVLAYVTSRASYLFPYGAPRYLNGLLLCTPLVVAPLWRVGQRAWPRLAGRGMGWQASMVGLSWLAPLSLGVLAGILALNVYGAVSVGLGTSDRMAYGVPASASDAALLGFLEAHGATTFYGGYWTCYRLLFEGQGKVTCAVRSDTNIFDPGFNRMDGYWEAVGRVPHPAYVFQLTASDDTPQQIDQLKARMAAGDPRFAGYTFAAVHSFTVAYYAGG